MSEFHDEADDVIPTRALALMARADMRKHELECAERWKVLNEKMGKFGAIILAALISGMGWMIVQLYSSTQEQIKAIQALEGERHEVHNSR